MEDNGQAVAEDDEQPVRRRIAGFRLGFEKIFKTTSIRLPCSAYTVYAEMRSSHNNEVFCRCFNGLHTIYDLKKWIYEKLLLPMNAYELSYAESGKVQLTDNMRLLTTQDSLDARSMATMRTVHDMSGNIPGVHSIGDIGVTRLYVRLKCRTCGDLLNSFSTCRKKKQMGHIEPAMNGRKPSEFSRPSSSGSPQNIQLRGRGGGRPHISGPPKPDAEGSGTLPGPGGDKGGVLVRQGKSLTSEQLPERLGTGAVVKELKLEGDRLHFELDSGSGPSSGWVSTRLKDKASDQSDGSWGVVGLGINVHVEELLVVLDGEKPGGKESVHGSFRGRKAVHFLVDCARGALVSNSHSVLSWDLTDFSEGISTFLHHLFHVGAFLIAWELRGELIAVSRVLLHCLFALSTFLVGFLALAWKLAGSLLAVKRHCSSDLELAPVPWTDQHLSLTCMAAAAAPYPIGSFLLVSRPPHWEEIWVSGYFQGFSEVLGRTTTPDGTQWIWVVVRLVANAAHAPVLAADGTRRPPQGVPANVVNWVCVPPHSTQVWEPDPVEVVNLTQEAGPILAHLSANPGAATINIAGVGGDLVPVPNVNLQLAPGGAGVAAGPANPGAAGLGLPHGAGGGGDPIPDLKALENAIQQLQALALHPRDGRDEKGKKKKKSRKKSRRSSPKRHKKKKKSKKGRRSRSTSSSSTSSSRSRSRSSISSSSSGKPLRWKEQGRDRKVTFSDLTHIDQLKLKKKGDLVAFASKHPGALTAHFLAGVFARLSKGTLNRSSQLRSECGSMGKSVCWFDRTARHEGSAYAGGDSRQCEQERNLEGPGHFGPAHPRHSDGEGQGRKLGEVRVHRAPKLPEGLGKFQLAGANQSVRAKLWRSWAAMGGYRSAEEGFDAFYFRAMVALRNSLAGNGDQCTLGRAVQRLFSLSLASTCKSEFKRPMKGRGLACDRVFPLAPMSCDGRFLSPDGDGHRVLYFGGNMIIAALNWLHGGQDWHAPLALSAAHRRVHLRIRRALQDQVMTDDPILTKGGLDNFLKQTQHYQGGSAVLALGVKGGVPPKAADVPLADHLAGLFPEMSRQVCEPAALLLPSRKRPRRVKRGYTWVSSTYPELVKKNVQAGLHRYKKPSQVAKHRGVRCLAGAFAVRKDETEDRVITDPSVNQLIDPDKLPRPSFAYIPHMRTITVPRGGVVVVSKRDARHYFHRLRLGRKWEKWLCGPPISVGGPGGETKQRHAYGVWAISRVGAGSYRCGNRGCRIAFRVTPMSIFERIYVFLEACRKHRPKLKRVVLPVDIWQELAVSAILLPFAQFDLSSEWSTRVEATDASMSGIGRSFATMPVHVVQTLARYSSTHGIYTNISLPWGVNLTQQHSCPLRKVRLPKERVKWKHLGCPWRSKHITLGEADAVVWAAGDRLRRPCDDGCRFVHPLDSVAVTGAMTKGRSSSGALNYRCRQVTAINISGGHDSFYPWVPSADNPADLPSRWFESPGTGVAPADTAPASAERGLEPLSTEAVVDLRHLPWIAEGSMFFIHLCSGPRSAGDLLDMVENLGGQTGFDVVGIAVDPLAEVSSQCGWPSSLKGDLLDGGAPAAPPELLQAMICLALQLNRPELSLVMLLAYAGLLRIREALGLRARDVVVQATSITLCLAVTKRGTEQKVVLTNPSVLGWTKNFFSRFPVTKPDRLLFGISYSSALRWVKKLAFLLGAGELGLTTHTFRRSGASELARLGMPLADILLYGRWRSERAARDYIRKGEVAVLRARGLISASDWRRIDVWANHAHVAWRRFDSIYHGKSLYPNLSMVSPDKLAIVESLLFPFLQ
eukprot:s806_g7.t1